MKKRQYTAEFKKEAARMIIIDGVPVKEVSEQLGVAANILYSWKQKHLDDLAGNSPQGVDPKAMAEEISQLRKQLAKSKRMNEILKKTVGYFSEDD